MKISYRIRRDEVYDQNGNKHTVWGVDVVGQRGTIIRSVQDVFFDCSKALDFVERCNKEELELLHLDDAVYNEIVKQLS